MSDEKIVAKMIRTEALGICGSDGTTRILFHVNDDGYASAQFFDMSQRERCSIAVDANGAPSIVLRDNRTVHRLRLDTWGDTPLITLFGNDGEARLAIHIVDNKAVITDGDGNIIAQER